MPHPTREGRSRIGSMHTLQPLGSINCSPAILPEPRYPPSPLGQLRYLYTNPSSGGRGAKPRGNDPIGGDHMNLEHNWHRIMKQLLFSITLIGAVSASAPVLLLFYVSGAITINSNQIGTGWIQSFLMGLGMILVAYGLHMNLLHTKGELQKEKD